MKLRIAWSALLVVGLALFPAMSLAQKATPEEIAQAAQLRMKAGLEKHKMEQAALENDPKVIASKDKLDQANKDWAALQPQVEEAIKSDPDYTKTKAALDAAETKLKDAKKSLADAQAAQAKADAAQRKSQEQARAASANSGRYGGSGSSSSGTSSTYKPPTTPKVSPLAGQTKAVKDAQDEVFKATAAMNIIRAKTERTLESRDDWKAAKANKDKAAGEYEAAVKPVLAALKTKPEYQAVLKQESDADAILNQSSAP